MSQNNYDINITLERKFTKTLKAILGFQFITQDPILDKQEGTDFAIMEIKPFKVGVRLRRYRYYKNMDYRKEFTIRWKLSSGNETEIDKIRKDLVQYIFYGFVNEGENKIIQYFIGDLRIFMKNEPKTYCIRKNKNSEDSSLAVYRLRDMPEGFIIKKYFKKIIIKNL